MLDPSIEFHDISKRYQLGGYHGSLRQMVTGLIKSALGKKEKTSAGELWALKDISFQMMPGEAVGIIGPNGAGKTTLLKILTSVTQPTSGTFDVHGRISALIELGAGFHPDLTGRENIYLNGAILGMKRQEIRSRFDEIVSFSELEQFLETPVKRYSSGMYARLGFSVAAHVNPQILVVDEVLAVGDIAFQAKCLARMADMKKDGTTILIVSHAMPRLKRLCSRAILLFRGAVIADGISDDVINLYQNNPQYSSNLKEPATPTGSQDKEPVSSAGPVRITGVTFMDGTGAAKDVFETNEKLIARIFYQADQLIQDPIFEIWVHSADGTEFASHSTEWDHFICGNIQGRGYIDFIVDALPISPGRFSLGVAITESDGISRYDWQLQRYWFTIESSQYVQGMMSLSHTWEIKKAK